ncbi:MAG: ATP-binding protein, partial [Desulfobacteraceae bacterium]|nr:ATP-binding protein [Desulfobacteraceae bacterium]
MRGKTRPEVSMSVPADGAFLPLTIAFVEKAALGLGLQEREAMALTLATEEIFAYLCRIVSPDQKVDVACRSGGYYVRVDFFFPVEHFEMRLFNLTAKVSLDDEASIEQMGLLIASRFVDRLSVREEPGRGFHLSLTKEKSYPDSEQGLAPEKETVETFAIRGPEPEELKLFVQGVKGHYASEVIPSSLAFAGKVVDMVAGGEYQAAVAVGPAGQMAGGILWHWAGLKTVECFGPYIFTDPPQTSLSRALLEACLGAIGKSHAVGLITRYATRDLPADHFETLGTL